MADAISVHIPQTVQELDEAVRHYHTSDLHGEELYSQWSAIRQASLEQWTIEPEAQRVPGEDSY